MKILEVVDFFKPSWEAGGIVRVCYEVSKRLVELGNDVTVYTTDGFKTRLDVPKNKPVNVEGICTYYFRNLSETLTKRNFYSPYFLPIIAKKEINRYDIIHIHTYRSPLAIFTTHYASLYNIPYIMQVHGSFMTTEEKYIIKYLFDMFWGRSILEKASKVVALTYDEAKKYKEMGINEDKITIITNGVDFSKFADLPIKGKFKDRYNIPQDDMIILYAGRLHKSKGIILLIDAFANLARYNMNCRLVIVGPDDGLLSEIQKKITIYNIKNRVLITGTISDSDKLEAYVDAELVVIPSFSGFPVTFLEACACCTPIITTNNGDKLDWIDNKVGYVAEYNEQSLNGAIIKLLYNKDLKNHFGEEGRRLVKEKFNWDKIAKQFETLYEDCLKEAQYKK